MSELQDILNALNNKSGFELIEHSVKTDQLRLIGRIPDDATKQNIHNWLLVTKSLLLAGQDEGLPWSVDISKQYFLKGLRGQEKVVYGHRLIIQCKDVAEHFGSITQTILGAKQAASGEVTSFPLPGSNGSRNESPDGIKRGARGLRS